MAKKKKVVIIDKESIKKATDEMKKDFDGFARIAEVNANKVREAMNKAFQTSSSDGLKNRMKELARQEGVVLNETSSLNTQMKYLAKTQDKTADSTNTLSGSFGKVAGILGGTYALKQFGNEIVNVRGEMEALERSFEVLLGSKSKSDAMVGDIIKYAVETPFGTSEISSAAKMLLGFGIEAEKVMPTIKQMGDISMGNVGAFNSLS